MSDGVWHRVAAAGDIAEDEPLAVRAGGEAIALCRVGGQIYAIADNCTHEDAPLSDGFIEGDCIECPLHQAQFHIPSGRVMAPPADADLRTFPLRVDDDAVYVQLEQAEGRAHD